MLDFPYVSPAEFRAHPTYLDTNNLRIPGKQTEQDAALNNALLTASQWADDEVNMPLRAHTRTENARVRVDRRGLIRYHPEHSPVVNGSVSMAVGDGPDGVGSLNTTSAWLEQDGRVLLASVPMGIGLNALQLGRPRDPSELFVSWSYIAGFPITRLSAPASLGASSVQVDDTTGITVGTVLRLWTPGVEEAVTVMTITGSVLGVAKPLAAAHDVGDTISALPMTARQAVINLAVASLLRPAAAAQENVLPGAPSTSSASRDPQRTTGGATLVKQAYGLLSNFKRVR